MSAEGNLAMVVGEKDAECDGHIWEPGVESCGKLVVESEDIQADLGVAKKIAENLNAAHAARVKVLVEALEVIRDTAGRQGHIGFLEYAKTALSAYRGG